MIEIPAKGNRRTVKEGKEREERKEKERKEKEEKESKEKERSLRKSKDEERVSEDPRQKEEMMSPEGVLADGARLGRARFASPSQEEIMAMTGVHTTGGISEEDR